MSVNTWAMGPVTLEFIQASPTILYQLGSSQKTESVPSLNAEICYADDGVLRRQAGHRGVT